MTFFWIHDFQFINRARNTWDERLWILSPSLADSQQSLHSWAELSLSSMSEQCIGLRIFSRVTLLWVWATSSGTVLIHKALIQMFWDLMNYRDLLAPRIEQSAPVRKLGNIDYVTKNIIYNVFVESLRDIGLCPSPNATWKRWSDLTSMSLL